ncbi:MAG TPA: Fic family protein [Vicinamibacteria bacterium]|nr:Fic family protein [Vicinamibacteria bacterium]
MEHTRLLRLTPSRALKERRLLALRGNRGERDPLLRDAVEEAQVVGSLALAGVRCEVGDVRAARRGEGAPATVRGLVAALGAVEPEAPFDVRALRAWHATALGGDGRFRAEDRAGAGPLPAAPAAFVTGRLEILQHWLQVESSRELSPAQQGALVLARVVEIRPFEDGNGRVARLAASHLMVRAGARPPVLVGDDEPRLRQALQAAFQLHTEPLTALLEEASERGLDVMIQILERPGP